jgi:geranylgeranyl pyrophosphate synthase
MIQIHDDLNDTMAVPANPDWRLDSSSLPILFAQVVEHADKDRFLELRQSISDLVALTDAQIILVRCGAVSYCIDQLLRRYQAAQKILDVVSLPRREGLEDLLDGVVEPVRNLFAAAGMPTSDNSFEPLVLDH